MRPNFIAENPANGHCHAGWVLTEPVCRTDMARLKPLKLLHAVTEGCAAAWTATRAIPAC